MVKDKLNIFILIIMKELMKKRDLKHVFLNRVVLTTWPGLDQPNSDKRPYSIREVCYDDKEDKISVWQHWDQTNSGHFIEDFEDEKVLKIEKELIETVDLLKRFEVKVTGSVYVMATSPEKAVKTVQFMSSSEIKEDMRCIIPTGEVE